MTTTLAQFCDPDDPAGFGRTGVDKILLMRCARMALRARLEGVPLGLWIAPWWRAILTLRQMFGEEETDDLCGEQLEVAVSRLMLIDFLTGSTVIGLATRNEYRDARDRIPVPGSCTWLGRRWERLKRTCSFFAEETAPKDLEEVLE